MTHYGRAHDKALDNSCEYETKERCSGQKRYAHLDHGVGSLGSVHTVFSGLRGAPVKPHKKRILMFAEAVTLAHVVRPLALASTLNPLDYAICIAKDDRYDALLGRHPFASRQIRSIPTQDFLQALAKGSPVYDVETLERYVQEDLEVMHEFDPDIVIGDFRLSLSVSCRLAKKPYIAITNAYWSPYAQPRYTVPDLPMVGLFGSGVSQLIFDITRPLAFAYHCHPLNRVRRRHGLRSLGHDLRRTYTDADHVLYADLPELVTTHALPPNHHYIGPVLWEPSMDLPDWWHTIPLDEKTLFISLGSSGPVAYLPEILAGLSSLPVHLLVATAGRMPIDRVYGERLHVANYLPAAQAIARSNLVICNGGSPTSYLALAAGRPVLGIPGNLDQFLNMRYLQDYGAGMMVRSEQASATALAGLVMAMLADESPYCRSARQIQTLCSKRRVEESFPALLASLLS